ncbi:hypothetical protein WICMUC_001778 [Wickerhamomyces mucosus]|uniref:Uncharacterized protein n=1 Tax=Wickerhamomyces mucosus TaxID=1378264 RepID=A0A9P8PS89_9ASCO|nr:hypothetical protein WICMUC_001778 [Wickerhamomyces mucosus]
MNSKDYTCQQLKSIVLYSLDNDLIPSAEFAAERLLAETKDDDLDSVHLYGLVLIKQRRFKTAYNLTINKLHIGCVYVFARAALELERGNEGIYALTSSQHIWESTPDNLVKDYEYERKLIPDSPVFFNLLGKLYSQVGDIKESCINHSKALKKNPFLWESFEELNRLGANVKIKGIYKTNPGTVFNLINESNVEFETSANSRDPFGESNFLNQAQPTHKSFVKNSDILDQNEFTTPIIKQAALPNAPIRKTRSTTASNNSINSSLNSAKELFKRPPIINSGSESIKRQPRLTASKVTSRLTQPLTSSNKSFPSTLSRKNSNPEIGSKRSKSFLSNNNSGSVESFKKVLSNEEHGEQELLNLYSTYAKGFKAMSRYDCFKAIRILSALPDNHLNTPWVLSKLGRLHFEIVNYEEAELYFQKLRKLDRTRVTDMEFYSTLLWHLHKEVELCYLSYELLEIDKNAPQTWVAIGNMFSLTREPDEAIKCFQRAIQIDENFAYAYTLQGHEYVSNDAYENALESFRHALLIDSRHYNALYGIGMVYLKLGNFNRAEFHFRKALDINPINVILICCVGMMLEKLGKKEQALDQYKLACKIQPLSALALFKKAQLLFSMDNYNEALLDFEYLVTITPDEASVHFLLGQLYKLSNRKNEAIRQFTTALNLDPKGSHLVKEALESLAN